MTIKLSILKQQFSKTPALLGTISLFFALIPLSLAPSLAKLSEQEIGANAIGFHRSWIAAVVFGLWNGLEVLRRQQSNHQPLEQKPFTKEDVWLLLAMGTAATISLLLWAWSLSQTSVANVALLSNLNPLFVAAAGYLLFGRRFDNRFIIGMVMALLGAIAFEVHKMQFANDQILGDALAFLSGIFIATYLLLIERLQARFSTATIMLWRCGVTTIFLLPILPFIEQRLFPYSSMGWFLIIFQALFCQV
ncbi:MAG: DMT family transporter, partial [Nostoc sp.]